MVDSGILSLIDVAGAAMACAGKGISSGTMGGATPHMADSGILSIIHVAGAAAAHAGKDTSSGTMGGAMPRLAVSTSECTQGYVDCDNGFVRGSEPPISCRESCNLYYCWVGTSYACEYFTGKICKDGSCSADRKEWIRNKHINKPCHRSKIDFVVNSCIDNYACMYTVATKLVNSCNDDLEGCLAKDDGCKVVVGDVCQNDTTVSPLPLTSDLK